MAGSKFKFFKANLDDIRMQDLVGATVQVTLHTSALTLDDTVTGMSENAELANELATGAGYTAGGATMANKAVAAEGQSWKFSSDNIEWTAAGGNIPAWRYAVFQVIGTLWGKTNPLIGYVVANDPAADALPTAEGNPLRLVCPAGGWFQFGEVE